MRGREIREPQATRGAREALVASPRPGACRGPWPLAVVLGCLLAGCQAGQGPQVDAWVASSDAGLAERYLTEVVPPAERPDADADAVSDVDGRQAGGNAIDALDASSDAAQSCAYLQAISADAGVDAGSSAAACRRGEACYPTPLDGLPTGGTRCAAEGSGDELAPCLSESDCDGLHACDGVGDVGGLCRPRCDPRTPTLCPRGTQCWAFPGFLTAGVCR